MRASSTLLAGLIVVFTLGCAGGDDEPAAGDVAADSTAAAEQVCACMEEAKAQVDEGVANALPEEKEVAAKMGWSVHLAKCVPKSRQGASDVDAPAFHAGIEATCPQHTPAFDRYLNSVRL